MGYFGGKIINFPERSILSTQISKAGRIEDQWYTAQLVIFVREIKKQLTAADLSKYIAQVMCELIGMFLISPCIISIVDDWWSHISPE